MVIFDVDVDGAEDGAVGAAGAGEIEGCPVGGIVEAAAMAESV
jgi:hypothetical protein